MLDLIKADATINPVVLQTRSVLAQVLIALVIAGSIVSTAWLLWPGRSSLFPLMHRPRRSNWTFGELLLALIILLGIPLIVFLLLYVVGFYRWQFGADPGPNNMPLSNRCSLWATVLAAPFVLLAMTRMVWYASHTRLQNLGLTYRRGLPALATAYLVWLVVTPPVFGVHYYMGKLQEKLGLQPNKHQLEQILTGGDATVSDWLLAVLTAVVVAPILEELFFRGLVQPWLAKRPWGGFLAWAAAVPIAGLESKAAMIFVMVFGAVVTTALLWRPLHWQAICGSALLFAAFHSSAWPAPVPLFFLAVALGWVAHRSRTLVAPIVLHALFNFVSTLGLLLGLTT